MKRILKKIGEYDIAYLDEGKGDNLLFCLPAWPSSSTVFRPFIDNCQKQNILKKYRIVAPDLPGMAGRSRGYDKKLETIEGYVNLLIEFITSFEKDNFSILGFSFGGLLAQMVTSKLDNIEKLILVSTPSGGESIFSSRENKNLLRLYNIYKKVPGSKFHSRILPIFLGVSWQIDGILKGTFDLDYFKSFVGNKHSGKLLSEFMKVQLLRAVPPILSLCDKRKFNFELDDKDVLIIYGEKDEDFIKSDAKVLSKKCNSESYKISGGTHNHFFYKSALSIEPIKDFLLKE